MSNEPGSAETGSPPAPPAQEVSVSRTPSPNKPGPAGSSPPKPSPPKSGSARSSPPRSESGRAAAIDSGANIEVDDAFDDDRDSAIGDAQTTYTSSLASSVLDYPVEYGRRYHAYRSGRYSRPNDEQEMDRLLLIHEIITLAIGGLYLAPIEAEKMTRILDIGTGTGAMTIGDEFPNAEVIGNDLSANLPTFVPGNVKFEVDDVESEWLHDSKFSWIFCRYMAASIFDWPKLVKNIHENLETGGWCEFQDFDLLYYSEDGSLAPDNPLLSWITTLTNAAQSLGRDPNPGSKLEGWVQDAGFGNIVHRRYKIPFGVWPKDPHLKELGAYNYRQLSEGLEGLTLRLYTSVLGWNEEEIYALLAQVRRELNNPRIHALFDLHVVYAQKL
ncbi:related to methyltransferase [Cephalotrichum gorgonifer]|uniref:Related to methyltransferase n=1 Tax=Cephalotrichum gorgonifer TaxID=2041049 RepID=A0AAE8SSD8_9PEZI|nr:related to methyltransferase [Cephalotrichum gorgonifer]